MSDPKLVYSLEIRLIDLEKKVASLESQIEGLTAGRRAPGNGSFAALPSPLLKRIGEGEALCARCASSA